MNKYIIKNGSAFFIEGSNIHNTYTFSFDEATLFDECAAEIKMLEINNWRGDQLEVIKIK